jgi:hypothetical protein
MGPRAVIIALSLLAGCATFSNTPQQERTLANWQACVGNSGARLTQVYPNGGFTWTVGNSGARRS